MATACAQMRTKLLKRHTAAQGNARALEQTAAFSSRQVYPAQQEDEV